MSSKKRIERLESEYGKPCPECGSTGSPATKINVSVAKAGEHPQPEYCQLCGRQTQVVIDLAKL